MTTVKVAGTGRLPRYGSDGAAGADLHASEALVIAPGDRAAVPTAIHVELPPGHVGLVWPRSGLALRHGGRALACSDMFFAPMNNLIAPGRSTYMGGGWETQRQRQDCATPMTTTTPSANEVTPTEVLPAPDLLPTSGRLGLPTVVPAALP